MPRATGEPVGLATAGLGAVAGSMLTPSIGSPGQESDPSAVRRASGRLCRTLHKVEMVVAARGMTREKNPGKHARCRKRAGRAGVARGFHFSAVRLPTHR